MSMWKIRTPLLLTKCISLTSALEPYLCCKDSCNRSNTGQCPFEQSESGKGRASDLHQQDPQIHPKILNNVHKLQPNISGYLVSYYFLAAVPLLYTYIGINCCQFWSSEMCKHKCAEHFVYEQGFCLCKSLSLCSFPMLFLGTENLLCQCC